MELDNFGRIGILMGGPSSEREISLKSGRAVYESLSKLGIDVVAIDIKTDEVSENKNLIKSFALDCAFIALHGRFGEDGGVQQILENLNIVYTGSDVFASKIAMDKVLSREFFEINGLDVPYYKVIEKSSFDKIRDKLVDFKLPFVVKPASQGSSVGLSIVDNKDLIKKAIYLAFSFDEKAIIEEYISGSEVTVGILDEKALPVIEIIPKNRFFDYQAKYQVGMTEYIVPARIEEKVTALLQEKALMAHKILGCFGCSRVDVILKADNTAVILEVNTIPGLTQTSLLPKAAQVMGIDFARLCIKLIELAYEKAQV